MPSRISKMGLTRKVDAVCRVLLLLFMVDVLGEVVVLLFKKSPNLFPQAEFLSAACMMYDAK